MKVFLKQVYFLLLLTLVNGYIYTSIAANPDNEKIKTVVIDPGHGGTDPGALGKNSQEKEVVLKVALKLGSYIESNFPDTKVIYTRSTDVFVPLHERAEIANRNNADLFISIHCNANQNKEITGAETYAMGLHKSEGNMDVAKKENAVILLEKDYSTKYEGFDPNSAESYIIFSLMQNTFLRQSLELASNVQTQFRDHVKRADRGVKQAGFLVLWKTSMPSVLIELGFISNSDEEKFLVSETGQDYLASAVYRAFKNYKAGIEQQSHFSPIDPAKIQPNSINKDTTTYFMVQLSSSKTPTPLNDLQFKGLNGVDQVNIKGTFKYVYGKTLIYDSAVKSKQEIKELFPDSFIISIRNNEQISLLEALKSIKNKP